jgi:conjugal transfer pilin signal peptidase TrbI
MSEITLEKSILFWNRVKVEFWVYRYAILSFVATLILFTQFMYVGISFDECLPDDHVYLAKKWEKTPLKGMKIAFRSEGAIYGPPKGVIETKYVYGLPGDQVTVGGKDGRDIFINGEYIGHAKNLTRTGKPLTVTEAESIPPGWMYVGTPSPDSYDSRYATVGLVPFNRIVGRIVTLF